MKSDVIKLRHERSAKEYPELSLEDNEYVELLFTRCKAGLGLTWAVVILAIVAIIISVLVMFTNLNLNAAARHYLFLLLLILVGLMFLIGLVLTYVYRRNRMYVTNLRIIRFSMYTPFSHSKNVINLVSVEDVSFRQNTIIQNLLHYGTIRLSTVGDETSYTFPFANTPKKELDELSHLISLAKEENKSPGAKGRAKGQA